MLGTNLNFKSYIGYFELFGERVPLTGIKKRLRAFKFSNIVGELAVYRFELDYREQLRWK
jgi:hypothetical protein